MKEDAKSFMLMIVIAAACPHATADVLELKNGKVVTGKYAGGTPGTVRFEGPEGIQVIQTSDILTVSFTAGNGKPAPASAQAVAPAPSAGASDLITVNPGTVLLVRLVDPVSSRDPVGKRFTTVLEADLVVNGAVVAKAGSKVYGRVQKSEQAGRYAGQSALDLRLTEIARGAVLAPLVTSGYAQAGSKSMGKTARGAATGAAIGAIADGGEGAGKGAAIGAVASGLRRGQAVVLNPGTLLEFRLQQPLVISASN